MAAVVEEAVEEADVKRRRQEIKNALFPKSDSDEDEDNKADLPATFATVPHAPPALPPTPPARVLSLRSGVHQLDIMSDEEDSLDEEEDFYEENVDTTGETVPEYEGDDLESLLQGGASAAAVGSGLDTCVDLAARTVSKAAVTQWHGRVDLGQVPASSQPEAPPDWTYPGRPSANDAADGGAHAAASRPGLNDVGDEQDDNDDTTAAESGRIATFRRSSIVSIGRDHPDPLSEPLAIRDTQPERIGPDEEVRIPYRLVKEGLLSSPQLESVALACRRFRSTLPGGARQGFLLGDGTGCGKGRCIAALILDQWNRGSRRHVWISATTDLYMDASRDINDLGTKIPICNLAHIKPGVAIDDLRGTKEVARLGPDCDGVLFLTYSLLVAGKTDDRKDRASQYTRFDQLLNWLRRHNNKGSGLICFDEAHKAKNLKTNPPTRCALRIAQLQAKCPACPVLYVTATGATEVNHLAYMVRLGLWNLADECSAHEEKLNKSADDKSIVIEGTSAEIVTQVRKAAFHNFEAFETLVNQGGVAAMELVAIQLRVSGAMSCRSLAFCGTTFELTMAKLDNKARVQYDASVQLWQDIRHFMRSLEGYRPTLKRDHSIFWAAQQRFFKGLLVAAKVGKAVELALAAEQRGEAVVFSLWTTNESVLNRARKGEFSAVPLMDDAFHSGPELTLQAVLHKFKTECTGHTAAEYKALNDFEARLTALQLPANPLDDLIDRLGGTAAVAEMSGRSHRTCRGGPNGHLRLESRKDGQRRDRLHSGASSESATQGVESVNIAEQRAFQRGEKNFAIITEAASAGISLHCDRREVRPGAPPPRPRRMICLELPWAADKAVQQLGRVHRSNQLHPPAFTCVVTELAGEARFIGAVTRRLKNLGAMTRGDRQCGLGTSGDAFGFGSLDLFSGPYGLTALRKLGEDLQKGTSQVNGPLPDRFHGSWKDFSKEATEEIIKQEADDCFSKTTVEGDLYDKSDKLKRFMNRMLCMRISIQQGMFNTLAAHVAQMEERDRKDGTLDRGVVSLNKSGPWGRVRKVEQIDVTELPGGDLAVRRLRLDRGCDWTSACKLLEEAIPDSEEAQGFYIRRLEHAAPEAVLILRRQDTEIDTATYRLHYPHIGPSTLIDGMICTQTRINLSKMEKVHDSIKLGRVERLWCKQYDLSASQCLHRQRGQRCIGGDCQMGIRCVEQLMLVGSILNQWDLLKQTIRCAVVARASLDDGRVLVGVLIKELELEALRSALVRRIEEEKKRPKQKSKSSRVFSDFDSEDSGSESSEALETQRSERELWEAAASRKWKKSDTNQAGVDNATPDARTSVHTTSTVAAAKDLSAKMPSKILDAQTSAATAVEQPRPLVPTGASRKSNDRLEAIRQKVLERQKQREQPAVNLRERSPRRSETNSSVVEPTGHVGAVFREIKSPPRHRQEVWNRFR